MNSSKINQSLVAILLTLLSTLVYSSSSANIVLNRHEANNEAGTPIKNEYKVPFLVLMSSSEICVAQLPMIDNGLVSVAYRLTGGLEEDEKDDESESLEGERAKRLIADVRQDEQMPPSTSLGKSEWQQIAGSQSSSVSHDSREEVGVRSEEDAVASSEDPAISGRSNREMGLRPGGGNNSLVAAVTRINNNANGSDVPESALLVDSNVTSAHFRSSNEEGRSALTEGGDSDKRSVQFSDFDVHMSLGYAFVADTRGRIHRFKLHEANAASTVASGRPNSKANLVGNDYYSNNAIVSSSAGVNSFSQTTAYSAGNAMSVNDDSKAGDSDGNGDGDDANKVDSGQVTHEQSGRHPSASGNLVVLENRSANSTVADVSSASTDTPTSDSHPATNNQNFRGFNGAEQPKIIWSRLKQQLQHVLSSGGANPMHRKQPPSSKGASPEMTVAGNGSQMAHITEQMENGEANVDEQQGPENQSNQTGVVGEDESREQTSGTSGSRQSKIASSKRMKTQVAVDWLNNLLFVLDKYRLVVMDFDGNNELVLIDDFNINNRPIDIKLDPVNDFLFWLQVGTFHNTIYKLDLSTLSMPSATAKLSANSLKLGQTNRISTGDGELVALISHHYAHPIITNLPRHAELFIINHKHSRIYVPLAPSAAPSVLERNKTQLDDPEVYSSTSNEFNAITHLNTSANQANEPTYYEDDKNCTIPDQNSSLGQILAYNLDGTDVGPLRNGDKKDHLSSLSDMQDITLDSERGLLYWLTEGGKVLFEEYKSENDSSFYSAEHALYGKEYMKLIHYGNNQPTDARPRFNLRKLIHTLSTSSSSVRWVRSGTSDSYDESSLAHSLKSRQRGLDSDTSGLSLNAPYVILGITCFAVLSIYLIYTFVFQRLDRQAQDENHSSIDGSSVAGSQGHANGINGTNAMSRWAVKPNTRSSNTSTFNRDTSDNDRFDSCEVDSTNYDTSNAIDEHYRDVMNNQQIFEPDVNRLAYLNEWPPNLHDLSNKLYVPVEVLQDEALSSIRRISIDQLEIERRAPLGKGHFGTVLQGTITCTLNEKCNMLSKVENASQTQPQGLLAVQQHGIVVPSSTSSGRGSSSTSSDFIVATSCVEANTTDYMSPKSQYSGSPNENALENGSLLTDSIYHASTSRGSRIPSNVAKTQLTVAIKRLKDNASFEEKRDFLQEAKLLANFNHPNIVHLIGICLDRGSTLIVMELMLGGDLYRYMRDNAPRPDCPNKLNEDELLDICMDIVNGCCYLEELNYIHRDLAARNCLVSSRKKGERVVKLADFGLARDIYKDSYYKKLNDSAMPVKWMAPECLTEQRFTTMSDVWSFGVVMWEVMSYCEERPFENVEHFFMKGHLDSGARLKRPDKCSDSIYGLMMSCWEQEPGDRPTFKECKSVLLEIKNRD